VACRTAAEAGAVGVLCLAFPLLSPQRDGPPKSRQDELDAVHVPVLVVQGENDRFGVPEPAPPGREVVVLAGDHGLKKDLPGVADAVRDWLPRVLSPARAGT
jgi:predicted alpha/beta-hydrolase family hydrolase